MALVAHRPSPAINRDEEAEETVFVECHDRIAVQMTDLVLQPVEALREHSLLAAVTLRALRGGTRFNITLGKTWPRGMDHPPLYWWRIHEIDATGRDEPDGFTADSASQESPTWSTPEDAYWAAVEALTVMTGTNGATRSSGAERVAAVP